MTRTLATFSVLTLGLGLLGCATADEAPTPDAPTFLGCLNAVRSDYQPLTAEELVDRAALIVRGHFDAVSDGRIVTDVAGGRSVPNATLVYRLRVTETLAGEERESAYLERLRGGCSAAAQEIPLADEEVMLFLQPPGWDPNGYDFEYPDRGRPPGEPLWVLPSPQGLLLESGGVAAPILEPNEVIFTPGSLDDVAAEVRALLEAR